MPRPGLPPTPASSTDILGQEDVRSMSLEMSFTLPPPAMASAGSKSSSSSTISVKSDSSYRPISPSSPTFKSSSQKQGRPLAAHPRGTTTNNADFTLPPPPTRSRKIIQMKPGSSNDTKKSLNTSSTTLKASEKKQGGSATGTTNKKQPSSTSVAGRKIARKTAHSLIERRRRSKMNEEFGVLKDMVPACAGQEMHKLAILQASIDYLRYLEQCVTDLKAANSSGPSSIYHPSQAPTPCAPSTLAPDSDPASENEDEDLEMEDQESVVRPSSIYAPALTGVSPILIPDAPHLASSSSTASSLPSPAFPPQYHQQTYQHFYTARSTEQSPSILPAGMVDADHEATTALLMLNTDRRSSGTGRGGGKDAARGMSVKDLLSS